MMQHDDGGDLAEFEDILRTQGPATVDAAAARKRRRARTGGFVAFAVIAALVVGAPTAYTLWALQAPLPEPILAAETPTAPQRDAAEIYVAPEGSSAVAVTGGGAYLDAADTVLGSDGALWTESGIDEVRPMASIAKVVAALVILDAHPIDGDGGGPTLTFGRADHALYDAYYVRGATIAAMPIGTSMSLRDALATMLVPSASNYAEAVSSWAFGSVGSYARAAERWLAANGLENTRVVEPTGLDPRNTSTARDLITLGRLAAANPVVARIVATPSMSVSGAGRIVNTNALLGERGITGLKTGTLEESGSNLLYTANLDVGIGEPLQVVGVMLGGITQQSVRHSVLATLDSIAGGFRTQPVAAAGDRVGTYTTAWGGTVDLEVAEAPTLRSWSDTPITVEMTVSTPAVIADGAEAGAITWTAGPESVTVPLRIAGDIEPPSAWWRLTHPGELG